MTPLSAITLAMIVPVPSRRSASVLALALALAACAAPKPAPPPRPAPPPPSTPTLPPAVLDWQDAPLSPGDWRYSQEAGGSRAHYGEGLFEARCDAVAKRVRLSIQEPLAARSPRSIVVTTTDGVLSWRAGAVEGRITADLAPSDPGLDRIAFSRGRFAVGAQGAPRLILPAWPEFGRVVEDCRQPVKIAR